MTTTTQITKLCSQCKVPKLPGEFHKRLIAWDGLQSYCIKCAKIRADNYKLWLRDRYKRLESERIERRKITFEEITLEQLYEMEHKAIAGAVSIEQLIFATRVYLQAIYERES